MTEEINKSFLKHSVGTLDKGNQNIGTFVRSDDSIIENRELTNHNSVKSLGASENFQNEFSFSRKNPDSSKFTDFKGSEVLNSLKTNLEGTLNCINYIKLRVNEIILEKRSEKYLPSISEKSTDPCSQLTNVIDLKSVDIPKDTSLSHIDDTGNDSNINSMEYEPTQTDKVNCNSDKVIVKNPLDSQPFNDKQEIKAINQPNSLSGITCISQEKLMINLISDDEDSDSGWTKVSAQDLGNFSDNISCLTFQEECSKKVEDNSALAQNEIREEKNEVKEVNQIEQTGRSQDQRSDEFGKQNVKRKKTESECSNKTPGPYLENGNSNASSLNVQDCLRKTENNSTPTQNECIEEKKELSKSQQRRSDEFVKQNAKRRKIVETDIPSQPRGFDFSGLFYKVKLTNLQPRVTYGHIASSLQKAGLEYVDILLVNTGSYKSYAEVSFTDFTSREKALSLDKTLFNLGTKMKIKAI